MADQEKEDFERSVLDRYISVSGQIFSNVTRGKRIDFLCTVDEMPVGIDLMSYQHSEAQVRIQTLKEKIFRLAEEKYKSLHSSDLTVREQFHHDSLSDGFYQNIPEMEIVEKIVRYVEAYENDPVAGDPGIDAMKLMTHQLSEHGLDKVFHRILLNRFPMKGLRSRRIVSHGAHWEQTISDHVDEIEERIQKKNGKYQGYVDIDRCTDCWLLMYHLGDPGSDIGLDDHGVSAECRNRLDVVAMNSPFRKIIMFEPQFTLEHYVIK